MASIEAQIQLILKGSSEIDKLQKKLDSIEDTAASIQDQFERGLFGRSSNLQTYMNALSQIGKAASAVRDQTKEIQSSNSEIKRTILLESQLRRERSRTARLSRAFEAETKGLDQTRGKLKEVKEQFDAISGALGQAFKLKDVQIVSQLRNELSALVEDQREWNRALAGTKNTGVNADLLKEQSAEYSRQITLLRERAEALGGNEALIRKLNAAERNLVKGRTKEGTFLGFADPRLGREQLKNAKALIQEEERLAEIRKRSAAEYENQQKQARREIQQTIRTIGGLAQKATGATFDALTFGKGPQIAKGFKNAAVRGGVGLGALGLGGAYAAVQQATGNIDLGMLQGPATQAASAIGGAINSALGGVPAIVGEMLSALGNIPGSLGLASVAALAFAPAMKTAGEAVFLAGKKFGESKFGENIKLTLDRQTNLFESVINKASEMNMVLDASRSGLDAVGKKIQTLPALPAAGQTAFTGQMRRGRGGAFIGGGAREITNPEFLATAAGAMAQRTQEAAQTSLMFAEGLGQAANEAKTIAEYLKQANELRAQGESSTQRFIRQTIERGRIARQGQTSADIARERSAFLTGSSYSLAQVPVRGELFPGGRTETAQPNYREMLNTAARVSQLQQEILESMSKQQGFAATIGQLERRTVNDKGRSLQIQQEENSELQRSIQIIRERNRELRQRPISAMTPQERVSAGILDPSSLRASRRRRIERGRARQESIRRATSEGLIGGAFPLLFGQGIGAAALGGAGGAIGGFAGGGLGFGLSLVGTALGTAFDQLNQAAQETGKALKYPVEAFDQLREAGLLASRQQEYYISKLIEAGRLTEAAGEIQAEIIKKIGVQGTRDLQQLGDSSSRLSKAWAEFNLQLQAAIAGPMADLLDWVSGIVGEINRANRSTAALRDFMQALSPEQQQEYLRRSIELRNQNNGVVDPAALRRLQQEILPGGVQTPTGQLTPEQLDQQKQAQAVTQELQAQVELQSKQLSLTGLTLERDGARYVNAAKAVALQEYDNKLLEIKNSWIGKAVTEQQKLAQLRGAELDYAMQLKQINEEIARRQEELYQNSLQAEMALYQQRQKSIELIVRYAEFNSGEEAGLREQLSLANNMRQQKLAEFYVEEELALIAAQKNGTYEQTANLYAERLLALEKELALEEAIAAQRIIQLQFNKALAIEDAKRQATDPFAQFRESQQLDEQFARNYFRLLQEGIAPAEAERLANFERLVSEQLRSLDVQIAIAQSTYDEAVNRGLVGDALKTYADNLERLQKARDAAREEAARGAGPAPQELPGMKIQEFISTAEEELRDLESVAISISERIGDAVGNSISSGISGLIEGTKTAQEVFADFLKNVGEILVSEGAKIIATYVAIGLARQFAGLIGGGSQAGKNFEMPGEAFIPKGGFKFPGAANGAYFADGVAAFAKGGMFTNSVVSSPTLFQFADGGVTRTGLMGEAGPEAIMPLKRGADGKLGVEASLPFQRDGSQAQGEEGLSSTPFQRSQSAETQRALSALASASIPFTKSTERVMMERSERETVAAINNPKPLDIRYESQVINGVEYITAEQHRKGMAEAAERGRTLALSALQNSVKTRKRVGMA